MPSHAKVSYILLFIPHSSFNDTQYVVSQSDHLSVNQFYLLYSDKMLEP